MRSFILVLVVFAQTTVALPLQKLAAPVNPPLDIDPNAPDLACDQIAAALTHYNDLARQNDDAVKSYLKDVNGALTGWYKELQPLEGTAQNLPAGTFSVLKDGANKINQLNQTEADNTDLLAAEMARITESLAQCQLVKPSVQMHPKK